MDFLNNLKNIEKLNENGMCQLCGMIAAVMEIGLEALKNQNAQAQLSVPPRKTEAPPVPKPTFPPVPAPTPWSDEEWVTVDQIVKRTGVKKHVIQGDWLPENRRLPGFPLRHNDKKTSAKRWRWGDIEASWNERQRLEMLDG